MSIWQEAKKAIEHVTGIGRPEAEAVRSLVQSRKPNLFQFKDDGKTPNNPHFPMIWYRSPVLLDVKYDPAAIFEELFATNGWQDSWRDGVYDFLHFHTKTHEVLGIARGHARLQFGGAKGRVLLVKAGDVLILPAGTGHRRRSASKDLLVVGAYPAAGKYDEPKPGDVDHDKAVTAITKVRRPARDPVYGREGPLLNAWKTQISTRKSSKSTAR